MEREKRIAFQKAFEQAVGISLFLMEQFERMGNSQRDPIAFKKEEIAKLMMAVEKSPSTSTVGEERFPFRAMGVGRSFQAVKTPSVARVSRSKSYSSFSKEGQS